MKFMYYNMYQLLYGSTIFLLVVAIFFEFHIFPTYFTNFYAREATANYENRGK